MQIRNMLRGWHDPVFVQPCLTSSSFLLTTFINMVATFLNTIVNTTSYLMHAEDGI